MVYEKNGQLIKAADRFLYLEELYLSYPNRWELFRSKTYMSKIPISNKNSKVYNKTHGCYVFRYWELIAAPKQFLIDEGFKLKL